MNNAYKFILGIMAALVLLWGTIVQLQKTQASNVTYPILQDRVTPEGRKCVTAKASDGTVSITCQW